MMLNIDSIFKPPSIQSDTGASKSREMLSEESFRRMIAIERKRTERTAEPFLLMLVEAGRRQDIEPSRGTLARSFITLCSSVRDIDIIGWYHQETTVGVIYPGLVESGKASAMKTIRDRVISALKDELTYDQFRQIKISFHLFPDEWDTESDGPTNNPTLYPDLYIPLEEKKAVLAMKRIMDIVCSTALLMLIAPLLCIIALLIKISSRGPVLFKQVRIGQYGERFMFYKFRSMYTNSDCSIHREYVKKLIADRDQCDSSNRDRDCVYKLTNDKRITKVGRILRRTSLDELPQLFNVLKGSMSLVGPRPALPYELDAYQTWHRRRILEVKPGITGLWQINGRSRVTFDEMVRLDLRYATSWTPWLDLKIIISTPLAVISGEGAY
jgi:lipopolysaccharide/colanic/teichoic acid biosynthesis glycosyltransferase